PAAGRRLRPLETLPGRPPVAPAPAYRRHTPVPARRAARCPAHRGSDRRLRSGGARHSRASDECASPLPAARRCLGDGARATRPPARGGSVPARGGGELCVARSARTAVFTLLDDGVFDSAVRAARRGVGPAARMGNGVATAALSFSLAIRGAPRAPLADTGEV